MNGWNDFEYNMAVGAGTCGLDYWLVPGANSGPSRKMRWESYASLQADPTGQHPLDRASLSPLKRFVGNYASSAMMSFNTVGDTAPCSGVGNGIGREEGPRVEPVANPLAPRSCSQSNASLGPLAPYACNKPEYAAADDYYPKVDAGGTGRHATRCSGTDCSAVRGCDSAAPDNCMVTVLDHYTSSFHWAQTNFAAIWLRNQWYLVENSVLTDVQNGGLSFITGGGYTNSDIIPGHWALVRNSVFIGNTQIPAENPYASNAGPFNPQGLSCDPPYSGNHCLSAAEGISFLLSNFAVNQRMLNIYDGPTYQDSNAYLDINEVTLTGCTDRGTCNSSAWPVGRVAGVPKRDICYMPNAAIGWKQPNGFYYPPAFHSTNLFFRNVDIRHFVIEPLTVPGTHKTDPGLVGKRYCTWHRRHVQQLHGH